MSPPDETTPLETDVSAAEQEMEELHNPAPAEPEAAPVEEPDSPDRALLRKIQVQLSLATPVPDRVHSVLAELAELLGPPDLKAYAKEVAAEAKAGGLPPSKGPPAHTFMG